jgi:hypothetical protein
VEESSLKAARNYVASLRSAPGFQTPTTTTTTAPPATTTTGAG